MFSPKGSVRSVLVGIALPILVVSMTAGAQDRDAIEVQFKNSDGATVGTARISKNGDGSGVRIQVDASGLSKGRHGLHIHGKGECKAPDFKSAGPHFSPQNRSHGFLNSKGPHAGDLPALNVGSDGKTAKYDFTTTRLTLDTTSLLDADGSSVIIHAKPDDYLTDPGGGSGDRILCGIISPASNAQQQ